MKFEIIIQAERKRMQEKLTGAELTKSEEQFLELYFACFDEDHEDIEDIKDDASNYASAAAAEIFDVNALSSSPWKAYENGCES